MTGCGVHRSPLFHRTHAKLGFKILIATSLQLAEFCSRIMRLRPSKSINRLAEPYRTGRLHPCLISHVDFFIPYAPGWRLRGRMGRLSGTRTFTGMSDFSCGLSHSLGGYTQPPCLHHAGRVEIATKKKGPRKQLQDTVLKAEPPDMVSNFCHLVR